MMSHANWCEHCKQYHGVFYICEYYDTEKQGRIREDGERFRENINDQKWTNEQLSNGVPSLVIEILRIFAG